jgi:hypothetical protein
MHGNKEFEHAKRDTKAQREHRNVATQAWVTDLVNKVPLPFRRVVHLLRVLRHQRIEMRIESTATATTSEASDSSNQACERRCMPFSITAMNVLPRRWARIHVSGKSLGKSPKTILKIYTCLHCFGQEFVELKEKTSPVGSWLRAQNSSQTLGLLLSRAEVGRYLYDAL